MANSDAYICCSAKRPERVLLYLAQRGVFVFLGIFVHSAVAEENPYDLPDIGNESAYSDFFSGNRTSPNQLSLDSAASYLKHYTHKQLTESSGIYLSPKGIILETEYSDNMATEFSAEGDGEITFTFSLSF